MKILHYVNENKLAWGESWIQLLKELEADGVDNYVVCKNGGTLIGRMREEGIKVYGFDPLVSALPCLASGFGRIVKEVKPDIIHTRLSSAAKIGGYWGRKLGIPVLQTVDKFPKAYYHKKATMLLPCSEAVAEHMESLGFPKSMMKLLPNTINVKRYAIDNKVREETRKKYGVSPSETVIIGAGRFVDWKGFDDMITGFSQSEAYRKGAKLWVVGSGVEEENLRALAKKLGSEGSITFIPFTADIRPLLWAADVFVQPSWGGEAFGIILIEAMASSLSCIATYNGGMKDIVENNVSGLHVPVHSPEKIAEAIDKNSDPALRKRLTEGALARAEAYDVKSVAELTVNIYKEFC